MVKFLRIAGLAWFWIAGTIILFGYASVWYFEGWEQLAEILSPRNFTNYLSLIITFAPGYILIKISQRMRQKAEAQAGQD